MVSREISDEDEVPHFCSPFPFEREGSMVHSQSVQPDGTLLDGSVQGSSCWPLFVTLERLPRQGSGASRLIRSAFLDASLCSVQGRKNGHAQEEIDSAG